MSANPDPGDWCRYCGKPQTRFFLLKHQHVCRMNPANRPLAEPYAYANGGCPHLAVCAHVYCALLRNATPGADPGLVLTPGGFILDGVEYTS